MYRCEMIRDGSTGSFYVEIQEVATAVLVYTGPRRKTMAGARRSALNALLQIYGAARSLSGSPAPKRIKVPR